MAKQYYCLVAGLKEYALDGENKGLDIAQIREEILEQLSGRDAQAVELLYQFYDIENIINIFRGKQSFNSLGNLSREELEEEIAKPERLPDYLSRVIVAYRDRDKESEEVDEQIDMTISLERNLWSAYYAQCAKSKCSFMRSWGEFDRTLRNICSAYTARKNGAAIADILVGDDDITQLISKSSAADFGLKNEVDYIDQLVSALEDNNILEKEHRLDMMRWNQAEQISTFDYFNINAVMAYLVKVNLIWRWKQLDRTRGEQMFRQLIGELSSPEIVDQATQREE